MAVEDFLRILPLVSALVWWAVGLLPLARSRFVSPFEWAFTSFAFLIGAWAFLDWIILGFTDSVQAAPAILLSNVGAVAITTATLVLLLATKWLAIGHSRRDAWLLLPVLGAYAIVWTGLTSGAEAAASGLRLLRDPFRYALWAAQQVAYIAASTVLVARAYGRRRGIPSRVRRRFLGTTGALVATLVVWIVTNIHDNLTQTSGPPWFSSAVVIPGAIVLVSLAPMTSDDIGEMLRAVSGVQERVVAVYLFYRTGEPLVALASGRNLPMEAEQLEGVLAIVGNFVETSVPSSRGLQVTAMRYDGLGIVAVRGDFVIAAAVCDGPAYDTVRGELIRTVRQFEERRWQDLGTWEEATKVAEGAAEDLSTLLYRPERTEAPRLARGSTVKTPRRSG